MFTLNRRFAALILGAFAMVVSLLWAPAAHAEDTSPVTVRGTVTSQTANPLAGVEVTFETCVDEFPWGNVCVPEYSGHTDSNGEFEIEVPQSRPFHISFNSGDDLHSHQYWNGNGETVESIEDAGEYSFAADGNLEIDVQLERGASIAGVVKGIDSEFVDHATVTVKSENDGKTVKQGEAQEGSYLLGGLPAGSYEVHFEHDGQSKTVPVTLARGQIAALSDVQFTADPIMNVTLPTIAGDEIVGSTLSAVPGTWSVSDPSFSYRWFADDVEIPGATAGTLVVTEPFLDHQISVEVTAAKTGFPKSEPVRSEQTAQISYPQIDNIEQPSVQGEAATGKTLTADPGSWDPAGAEFSYQWLADNDEIVGATQTTLRLTEQHLGQEIKVEVTAALDNYDPLVEYSESTERVIEGPLTNSARPTVSGTPVVGKTLTAKPGSWSEPGASVSYRWFANGVLISGAYKSTFKLTKSQLGKQVTVGVAATKAGFVSSARVQSASTAKVGYASSLSVKTKAKKKRKVDFSVTVKANKKAVRGKIVVYRGTKRLKTVSLSKKGKATIKLSKQPKGKQTYTVKYVGSGNAKPVSKTVKVTTKK